MKKLLNALVYSINLSKKHNVICFHIIVATSIITFNLPLITNYFAKDVIESITLKTGAVDFLNTILMWTMVILLLKALTHLTRYCFSQRCRVFRKQIVQQVNHIRMSVQYERTLDSEYQKKLSIARMVMNRSVPCVVGIQKAIVDLVVCVASLFVYVSIIAKLHWGIICVCAVTYVITLFNNIASTKLVRTMRDTLIPLNRKTAYVAGRSGDIQAAKDIRVYDLSKWFSSKYMEFNNEKVKLVENREHHSHINRVINSLLIFIRNAISYVLLLLMYTNGKIEISDVVFFIGIIATFSSLLSKLQGNIQAVYKYYLEVNDYIAFEDCSECLITNQRTLALPDNIDFLEFVNVSYCYPGSSIEILSNINLVLQKNEKIGLVGLNGAGKTTLVLLMCGLLRPTKGYILLNGVDITHYDLTAYINMFSAVFQDISVLPDSVRNNIGLKAAYTREELEKIRELTIECGLENIDLDAKFIKEIFDDAISVSGGEMQKLALVRAIYKKSKFLILDEPTASLDPLAEQQLYINYGRFSENKISIFISHRLASTTFCDRIVMLEHGSIIESGSHDQLMEQNGKYKMLFESQREYYKTKSMEDDNL